MKIINNIISRKIIPCGEINYLGRSTSLMLIIEKSD